MTFPEVPFLEALQDASAGNRKVPKSALLASGALAVVDQGRGLVAGYTNDPALRARGNGPAIIFGDHTRSFKYVDFPFAMGADGVKVLRARAGFDTKYLFRYLESVDIPSAGYSRHFKFLKEITVPKPPINEQRRIATILDHADALRAKHQEIQTHLRELTAAAFRERFGPSSWMAVTTKPLSAAKSVHPWVSLSSVARLATGHTPSRDNPGYWDGDIPWISLPDIRALDGQITFDTTLHVTAAGIKNSSAVLLPRGTVCFSRTASLGFVTTMGAPMATSQDFHNWVPGPEIDSTYLREALRISRAHLIASSDGSTHRTIYQRTAETFHVMLPPRDEQLAYADAVAAFQAQAERNTRVLIEAEELFSSLRARAFSGRL